MINQATIDLVKDFEGLRLKAYKDSAGVLTIGYGTTAAAGLGIAPKAGMVITEAEAEGYLIKGMERFAASIKPKITAPINDNEFGAFLSLAYNIGPGAFAKSSALRKFNAGDKAGAADAILMWNKAGGKVLAGLKRRRDAERAMFLSPVTRHVTPVTRPAPHVNETAKIEHEGPVISKTVAVSDVPTGSHQNPIKKSGLLALILSALAAILKRK